MRSNVPEMQSHARTLRAWQLALLRFAVTLDNADKLAVLMIAAELDGLGPRQGTAQDNKPEFSFFRKTSAELCAVILRPNELAAPLLRQHLARIDDDRLRDTFAAAVQTGQPGAASVGKPAKHDKALWRGLSSRRRGLR